MTNIIFDFDGTIVDSFPTVVKMVSRWLDPGREIDSAEIERLKSLSIPKLLQSYKVAPWRVPGLVIRGRIEMNGQIPQLRVFEGLVEIIKKLNNSGVGLYIVSTNSKRNIRKFLKQASLEGYFKHVYGSVGLLGKAKVLTRVVRANHLDKDQTIYIGDEVRDMRAAQKADMKVVAVSWGFNVRQMLVSEKPQAIVDKPAELIAALKSLKLL